TRGLQGEIQRLAKWKNVADAEIKAGQMRRAAQVTSEKANADAHNLVLAARQKATAMIAEASEQAALQITSGNNAALAITAEAKEKAKTLKDESQSILDSVTTQAAKILD